MADATGQDGDHTHAAAAVTPIRRADSNTIEDVLKRMIELDDAGRRDDYTAMWVRIEESLHVIDDAVAADQAGRTGYDGYTARRRRVAQFWRDGGLLTDLFEDDDASEQQIGMPWADMVRCFTAKSNASHPSRLGMWTGLDWFGFENALLEHREPTKALADELGVERQTLLRLMEFFYDAEDHVRRR